jgi:hypothetical protein
MPDMMIPYARGVKNEKRPGGRVEAGSFYEDAYSKTRGHEDNDPVSTSPGINPPYTLLLELR